MTPEEMRASATIIGNYRYNLVRQWEQYLPVVTWIMLNPSTADANLNDPTIRRCINFTRSWGYGGIHVVNLFAWRATRPTELRHTDDPIGPENDRFILEAIDGAAEVVAAWGASKHINGRSAAVGALVREAGYPLMCLGVTKNGHPRHPLYVRSGILLERLDRILEKLEEPR